jgi:hypothetical protein
MTIDVSFQVTFADSVAGLIHQAYTSGVLQHYPMTVAGITVEMTMFSNYNQLTVRFNNRLVSISMYDEDSEHAQLSSVRDLVTYVVA